MKLLVHNQQQQYELLLDEDTGDHILDVLCGRVGQYMAQAKLTDEQLRTYQEQGLTALDVLAKQVRQEEDRKVVERLRHRYDLDWHEPADLQSSDDCQPVATRGAQCHQRRVNLLMPSSLYMKEDLCSLVISSVAGFTLQRR